ncbi:hypothetical protein VIBNISOn1_1050035 [Vibrio nigripulchritudo SOn1]|uniref:Uncharacterized protein n=1 Tax=Vibrio nigripulchritudo SOn1 TaxID=1238450 RepID=A0AAV2VIE8_9VIBR|nr:hypothetical protein VIBNISOn1_1050035 [Vibrio nigripulchritudo SOn1]
MIYLYSKSTEVTGVLHPLSSETEKKQFESLKGGMILQPTKFSWCQIKPHMLSAHWYENEHSCIDLVDESRNGFQSIPTGIGLIPKENRLFWQMQATKHLLRYLDYRQSSDIVAMEEAKKCFKLALLYRRTQRGLINETTCPSFFNHDAIKTIISVIDIVEALRSTRHKNMRLIENSVRNYLYAVIESVPQGQFVNPTVNEALTIIRLTLFEKTATFYQGRDCDLIQCTHNNDKIATMLTALASEKSLQHLNKLERIVPQLGSEIETSVNEAQKLL